MQERDVDGSKLALDVYTTGWPACIKELGNLDTNLLVASFSVAGAASDARPTTVLEAPGRELRGVASSSFEHQFDVDGQALPQKWCYCGT